MGGGVSVTTQRKKIKLWENVGWVVGCRVGVGICGKIYGIIYKGGKM